MEKPLVSIIVPIYKAEKWLHRCVDSILAQTMEDFELLLIDDGSPDRSGEICDEYAKKDKRVKVIHQENKGSVGARNAGLSVAKGKYLAFVDSDDYVREDMLFVMLNEAENRQLDIVWCGVVGELVDENKYITFDVKSDVDFMIKGLFDGKIQGWLCNKLIRKSFWDRCDIFIDERYCILEDVLISIQLFYNRPKQGKVDECFYVYNRMNEDAYTAHSSVGVDMLVKSLGNVNLVFDFLIKKDILEKYKKEFCLFVMKIKIPLLNIEKTRKLAIDTLPFVHKRLESYPFKSLYIRCFYWVCFNCSLLGRGLLFIKKYKN